MNRSKSEKGFTFIEVLIVLAMIIIIAIPVLRFIYKDEIEQLAIEFWGLLGIAPTTGNVIAGVLFFSIIVSGFILKRKGSDK